MANYYHEARAHAKNIRLMQDDNRRRAERRAEKAGVEVRRRAPHLRREICGVLSAADVPNVDAFACNDTP